MGSASGVRRGSAAAAKLAELIDEYGDLSRQVEEFRPTAARKLELEKEIASWYDDADPEQEFVASGARYTVQVSARALVRKITDMAKLFALVGRAKFLEICTVPVGAIDRAVDPEKHGAFLSEDRSGKRGVKSVPRQGTKAA